MIEGLYILLVSVSKIFIESHYVLMVNLLAINGEYERISGTSGSTPVIAAMITMINDARLSVGKKPVGFINPTVCFPHFHRWTLKLIDL